MRTLLTALIATLTFSACSTGGSMIPGANGASDTLSTSTSSVNAVNPIMMPISKSGGLPGTVGAKPSQICVGLACASQSAQTNAAKHPALVMTTGWYAFTIAGQEYYIHTQTSATTGDLSLLAWYSAPYAGAPGTIAVPATITRSATLPTAPANATAASTGFAPLPAGNASSVKPFSTLGPTPKFMDVGMPVAGHIVFHLVEEWINGEWQVVGWYEEIEY